MDKIFIKERIRYYRLQSNKSARNLSLELGMSSEYINQIETGRLTPSLDFLLIFCEYLNISLSEFFNEEFKYPIEFKNIITKLNMLSKDNIELISKLIDTLSEKK